MSTETKPRRRAKKETAFRLDLAGGQNVREGFVCVDKWEGAEIICDLQKFPWPWADASVDELHCAHYVEHIPMEFLPDGRDALCAFVDECWRILKPGGKLTIVHPFLKSMRAFQDPTHRRFIPSSTWFYFTKSGREEAMITHYPIVSDFKVEVAWQWLDGEVAKRAEEYQQRVIVRDWDVVMDLYVTLTKPKNDG